jgi:hypothetical protein
MKKRTMEMISSAALIGTCAAATYLMVKNKKNMLDVIIEEIETMK